MATSYNGWPASDDRNAIGVDPNALGAGVKFPSGIKGGDVAKVLGYVADQLQARVEQVTVNPDGTGYGCWGHTYKANVNNPSQLSCHASGTAIDWIAPSHPNGVGGTFSDQQRATIYAILDEVQGGVDWLEGYDEMHFEIAVSASTLAGIAATLPSGGGPIPPVDPPIPPGVTLPLIVKRADGVDWAWSDDMSFMLKIPTQNYYLNLQFAGVINVEHGTAEPADGGFIEWYKGQVLGRGGTVFEPAQ
jgi:hypothetical protein